MNKENCLDRDNKSHYGEYGWYDGYTGGVGNCRVGLSSRYGSCDHADLCVEECQKRIAENGEGHNVISIYLMNMNRGEAKRNKEGEEDRAISERQRREQKDKLEQEPKETPKKEEPKQEEKKKELYTCQCLKCKKVIETDKHCKDIKCPKCNGDMRRKERPGIGKGIEKKKKPKKKQNPEKIIDEMLALLDELRVCLYKEIGNILSQIESLNRQVETGMGDAIVSRARRMAMRRRLLGK